MRKNDMDDQGHVGLMEILSMIPTSGRQLGILSPFFALCPFRHDTESCAPLPCLYPSDRLGSSFHPGQKTERENGKTDCFDFGAFMD